MEKCGKTLYLQKYNVKTLIIITAAYRREGRFYEQV
jgi:hypothetical protein